MILFGIQALICAFVVVILLKDCGKELSSTNKLIIVLTWPILSLGVYLSLGNPNTPSASAAFDKHEGRTILRILNSQNPEKLDALKKEIQEHVKK